LQEHHANNYQHNSGDGSGSFFSPPHSDQLWGPLSLLSYPMGTRGTFLQGKVAAMWSWPLTSI